MQSSLIIFTLLFSMASLANCEYLDDGYHTIASYQDNKKFNPKRLVEYYFIDPFWYFSDLYDKSYNYLNRNDSEIVVDFLFKNRICSENSKSIFSSGYLKFPACIDVVSSPDVHTKGYALHDIVGNKIHIPQYLNGSLVKDEGDREKKIRSLIEVYLNKSDFWASQTQVIVPKEMKIKSIEFFHFNSIFSSSTVNVEIEQKGSFFVIFLIANEQLWAIADSSGLTKCGVEPDLKNDRKNLKVQVTSGWDYNDDSIPDLIIFNGFEIIYYQIEFGKKMTILKDMSSHRQVMRHNQDHGLKPKK